MLHLTFGSHLDPAQMCVRADLHVTRPQNPPPSSRRHRQTGPRRTRPGALEAVGDPG